MMHHHIEACGLADVLVRFARWLNPDFGAMHDVLAAWDFFQTLGEGVLKVSPFSAAEPHEERECVICMSEPREVRFSCGHAVCCRGCAESLLALEHPCPTCRTSDISMAEIGTFTQQPTYVQQRRPNAPTGLPGVGGLGLPPPPNQQMNRPAGSRQINIPELPGLLGLGGPQPGLPGSVAARLNPRAHSFRQAPPGMGWAGGGGGLGGGLPGFSDVVWAQPQQPTVLPPPQPVLSTDSAPLVPPNPPAAASEDHHSAAPGGSMDSPQLQPLPASWLGEGGDVEGAVLEMEPPPGEVPAAAAEEASQVLQEKVRQEVRAVVRELRRCGQHRTAERLAHRQRWGRGQRRLRWRDLEQ